MRPSGFDRYFKGGRGTARSRRLIRARALTRCGLFDLPQGALPGIATICSKGKGTIMLTPFA